MRNLLTGLVTFMMATTGFANGGSTSVGPGSPAAYRCIENGGFSFNLNDNFPEGNQNGACQLDDGSIIVDWTLFRKNTMAARAFLGSSWSRVRGEPIENWAAVRCVSLGGTVLQWYEHLRPGRITEICEFPDNSHIEIWTLFSGPNYYPLLAKLLK